MTLLTDIFKNEIIPAVNASLGAANPYFGTFPVQFHAGHYVELTTRIDKTKQGPNPVIYPLVWLVMDFRQDYTPASLFEYEVKRTQIFIVEKSDGTSSSLERIERVFKPILIPVWERIRHEIELSASFVNPILSPTVTLHPYATGISDKRANLFNDTVDAIEISNLDLQIVSKPIC